MQPQINLNLDSRKKNMLIYGILLICLILLVIVALESERFHPAPKTITAKPNQRYGVLQSPVFDYGNPEKEKALKEVMDDRKSKYNLENSVDMIVREDETIKIKDKTVRIQDIIEKVKLSKGEIVEDDLSSTQNPIQDTSEYGIHIVMPQDNIWGIHFNLLRDYYSKKGITLRPGADAPLSNGKSSGVGKLLKFSEKMVYIYNIDEKRIDANIDVIHPSSKIIVYNMKEIFSLLEGVDYSQVNQIQFDGENLWMPSPRPSGSDTYP